MKACTRFHIVPVLLALTAVPGVLCAQDYFRELDTTSTTTLPAPVYPAVSLGLPSADASEFESTAQYQAVEPPGPDEADHYNMAIGPVRFNAAAGVGVEYNDNITLASSGDEIEDFIIRPSVTIDATWQLSEMNTLRFSIGASYAKYLDHDEFDSRSVLLSPTSELAMTVLIGNVRLTSHDRFSYQEDPYDLPTLSNTAVYRRFENDAGSQIDWDLNEFWRLTAGYSHYNLWTFDNEFDSLERAVDTVYLRPSYQLTPAVRVGVNGSASWVDFDQNIQNDGVSYLIGGFAEIEITQNTKAYVEVGWQDFEFDDNGTIDDNEDSSSVYARVELLNQLSSAFSHRLGYSHTAEVGFGSNFYTIDHVEYGATWGITESLSLRPTAFYEYYETSDGNGAFTGEEASRVGASLGLRYVFTPSLTLGLDYRFLLKDSNLNSASYKQNLVLLSMFYNF